MFTFLAIWFLLGLALAPLSYSLEFAYWQRKYPTLARISYENDQNQAIFTGLLTLVFPPIFIGALLFSRCGKHGLKFK